MLFNNYLRNLEKLLLCIICFTINSGATYIQEVRANILNFGADSTGNSSSRDAIQAAVEYVKGIGGGAVYFPQGKYLIEDDESIELNNCKDIRLFGESNQTMLTKPYPQMGQYSIYDLALISVVSSNNISIENLRVRGAAKDRPIFKPIAYDSQYGPGIRIIDSKNCKVENCYISDFNLNIYGGFLVNSKIVNNYIHGKIGQEGICFYDRPGLVNHGEASSYNLIENNIIDGESLSNTSIGIRLSHQAFRPKHNIISDNIIRNVGYEGICINNGGDYNVISNNNINNVLFGVMIYGGNYNNITGNNISNTRNEGIGLMPRDGNQGYNATNNIISNNILKYIGIKKGDNPNVAAINVVTFNNTTTYNCNRNFISDNLIDSVSGYGIRVEADSCDIINNSIKGVTFGGMLVGSGAVGIPRKSNKIIGNTIFGKPKYGGHGLYIYGEFNYISNNTFSITSIGSQFGLYSPYLYNSIIIGNTGSIYLDFKDISSNEIYGNPEFNNVLKKKLTIGSANSPANIKVNGSVIVKEANQEEPGSIQYKNGHFYGRTESGWIQLDN